MGLTDRMLSPRFVVKSIAMRPVNAIVQPIMTAKTLTLRLHPENYERAAALADRRHQSLNRLFQEGLELLIAQEQDKQLFEDFSLIAEAGEEETDVDFALPGQLQATDAK